MINAVYRGAFIKELLEWYYEQNYNFPWRNSHDPYSIWLSEVMLQQTRVSTVLPYYKRWLSVFPDIPSVAKTNIDSILKLWEGLGYYSRARNFYRACQIVIEKYGGEVPRDPSEFLKLPGAGPFINAAVMSIAFNLPVPAIDANAARVVSRLICINKPFPQSKKRIYSFLAGLIDPSIPGTFNQAIMDLGREICTPKTPACYACPVSSHCLGYMNNTVDKYPIKIKRPPLPHYNAAVGMVWKNNKVLISKRKESGFLGGLWEFPGGRVRPGESGSCCVIREVQKRLNVLVNPMCCVKKIRQTYSHFSISIDAYRCKYRSGRPRAMGYSDYCWVYPYEVHKFAFHRAGSKLFDVIKRDASV